MFAFNYLRSVFDADEPAVCLLRLKPNVEAVTPPSERQRTKSFREQLELYHIMTERQAKIPRAVLCGEVRGGII